MLKNDLLKNNGEIIRIITIKNNYALVINYEISYLYCFYQQ